MRKRNEVVNEGQTTKGLNFAVSVYAWKACRAAAAARGVGVQSIYRQAIEDCARRLEAERKAEHSVKRRRV